VLAPAPVIPPDTVVIDTPVAPGRPGSVLGPAAGPGLAALAAVPPLLQARIERIYVADDGDVSVALTGNIGAVLGPAAELPAKFQALLSVLVDVPPTAPEDVDVTVPGAPAVGPAVALEGPVLPTPAPAGSPAGTRAGARAPGGTTAAGSGAPQVRREGRGPS
jgi:hypothetical protein